MKTAPHVGEIWKDPHLRQRGVRYVIVREAGVPWVKIQTCDEQGKNPKTYTTRVNARRFAMKFSYVSGP